MTPEIVAAPGERRCFDCGHVGSDWDPSATEAFCGSCGSTVSPIPVEDECSVCQATGAMGYACPECGGDYANVEGDPLDDTVIFRNVLHDA